MQQQSKAYHQAVEAYLEGAPLKAATNRKPVTLFGHQPKTQPQTTSRLGRLQSEQQTKKAEKSWVEQVRESVKESVTDVKEWSSTVLYQAKVAGQKHILPKYEAAYNGIKSETKHLYQEMRALEAKGRHMSYAEIRQHVNLKAEAAEHAYKLAVEGVSLGRAKALFFAAGKVSGIYTLGSASYEVAKAPVDQKMKVAFEQGAEVIGGSVIAIGVNALVGSASLGVGLGVSVPLSLTIGAAVVPLEKIAGGWVFENVYRPAKFQLEELEEGFQKWSRVKN